MWSTTPNWGLLLPRWSVSPDWPNTWPGRLRRKRWTRCVSRPASAKCDLVTEMVMEFPTLQGVMGKEYARLDGHPEEVCLAVHEHYLPERAGGDLPTSDRRSHRRRGRSHGHDRRVFCHPARTHRRRRSLCPAEARPGHHPHHGAHGMGHIAQRPHRPGRSPYWEKRSPLTGRSWAARSRTFSGNATGR